LFFLGLSLGGLTSFLLSFKLKVDGIILMAPALKPAVGKFLVGLANVVGWMLPKFQTKKIS
jgi:esterase/lipase